MLYVSTRNAIDTYTAHRALCDQQAPDGGFYLPFHQPAFTEEEMSAIKNQSVGTTVAQILNLFFGVRLTGWDVDCAIGRAPFKTESLGQRLSIGEIWRNPGGSGDYLVKNLYGLSLGEKDQNATPAGWSRIAIEIALLFGLYSAWESIPVDGFDVAATIGDFSHIIAILYAKNMGLPVGTLVCTCNENSGIWDLLSKGEFNTGAGIVYTGMPELDTNRPKYLEYFIAMRLGFEEVPLYLDACDRKAIYRIDEIQLETLREGVFPAVVSAKRVDAIASGIYRTNQYAIDPYTALAYGGLQDFRAHTGISKDTLIVAKLWPTHKKE